MVPGHPAGVFHRQLQAPLIAENGFVLRPMVLKGPVNVLQPGAEEQIEEKNHQLQHTLQQVPQPHGGVGKEIQQGGGGQRREDDKQGNGKGNAHHHGKTDDPLHQPLAAKVLFQPGFKLGGRLLLLLVRVKFRRPHQGLHPFHQGGQKVYHPPEEGKPQNGIAVLDELQGLLLDLQFSLLVAHHNGLFFRPPHEDSLNERLPADGGAKRALLGQRAVVFLFHSIS